MSKPVILVIDQGTSSTKAFLFDKNLNPLWNSKIRHAVVRKQSGWAECDAEKIWSVVLSLMNTASDICHSQSLTITAMGTAFQRSTFLFWNKESKRAVTQAMSWQDNRAKEVTEEIVDKSDWIHQTTGTPLSPHFGGPKFLFSIRQNRELKKKVLNGEVYFGTLSTFITHRLTGQAVMDESIASRSLLFNLNDLTWDQDLLKLFEVPINCLPDIVHTCGDFGTVSIGTISVPLLCVIGDQQASLLGQNRWEAGETAINFGTSGSLLVNSGMSPVKISNLVSSILFSTDSEQLYLLEGTINSVSVLFKWLEVFLGISHEEMNWGERCHRETDGILIPGMNGISAPYWTGEFDTAFFDFPENCHPNEYVRAGMESIGFLTHDIYNIIQQKTAIKVHDITASGGASKPELLQFISDLLGTSIWSSAGKDMTALGVARLVAEQVWDGTYRQGEIERVKKFVPTMTENKRQQKIQRWENALRQLNIIT